MELEATMPRLPQPGSDHGTWGDILNDYLSQTLNADGALKDNIVTPAAIANNAVTTAHIQSGTITEAQLNTDVQNKLNAVGTDYVTVGGALGTPSSGTLTNLTGLPVAGITASTSATLGVGSVALGHISDTTLSRNTAGVLAVGGVAVPTISSASTLTNKRVTKRVTTTTSAAAPAINTDVVDVYGLTAQAVDITSLTTNLTGTPTNGDQLLIYIVGTASRAINWGSSFEGALPNTTNGTARLDIPLVWNALTSKWRPIYPQRAAANITSSAIPSVDISLYKQLTITSLSTAITSLSSGLSGISDLTDGAEFIVTIKDDGIARAITFGATWVAVGVSLPTTTVSGKWLYLGAKWRSSDSKLVLLAVSQET